MSNEAFNKWLKENYPDYPPFSQDVWQAAKADSEQEIAKLKAANEWLKTNPRTDTVEWYENKINSLELYINELVESCACECENHWDVDSAAAAIRKLKV